MAGCCAVPEKPQSADGRCPECGRKGKPVPRITLEKLLTPEAQRRLTPAAFLFCETPNCPVVYFAPDDGSVFYKPDLMVRVGIKETEPPIPLCYCFGFTREMLWSELAQAGKTTIPDRIKAEVQAGNCRCEETNPRGSCCLGDIQRAIQAFRPQPVPAAELVGVGAENCCALTDGCCAMPSEKTPSTTLRQVGTERLSILASVGAMFIGLLASACCWLPALLAAIGLSSVGLGAKFAPYRLFFAIGALALIRDSVRRHLSATTQRGLLLDSNPQSPTVWFVVGIGHRSGVIGLPSAYGSLCPFQFIHLLSGDVGGCSFLFLPH
ncbi:MAG: hypothetical protein HZLCBSQH_000872 [Candidatus Fervidibacterota bacterium]